jgi:hypothetical protein
VGLFGFGQRDTKKVRPDPRDREKSKGAREYEARHQDRVAERRESQGDLDGARIARAAAAALRAG